MPDTIDVLLVDDTSELTAVAAELLEREEGRLNVVTETDPERGLARLEDGSFDCLITDYGMSSMDGVELLRSVRDRHPGFPVILFTGKGDEAVASEAISAGATDYVRKGTGNEQYALLANRIVQAVSKRRNRERADRLERVRELARDVNRSLVRADSVEAVERSVCEHLVAADPYVGAMIGADEAVRSEAVTPAGDDEIAWEPAAAWDADGVATTIVTGGAVVTVPLTHVEGPYGVLSVRAADPDAIGDPERGLLKELADDVASALHRVEMRADLRESEAKYRRLVEQNLVGVYIIRDGEFEYVNPRLAEMFGYTQAEMHSTVTPFDVVIEEDRETLRENLQRRKSGEVTDLRYTLRGERKDGSEIEFEVHGGRIEYDGESAVMGTLLDVTKRRRQERELERQNERLEEVASVVSHDLRNPLNVASGRIEGVRRECDSPYVEDVANALDRMADLIDDLLTLTGRRGDIDPEPVTLDAIVEGCWANVVTDSATLRVETDDVIRADRSRLRQVFENLFRNSVEHGSTDSRPQADDSVEHGSTNNRRESAGDSVEHSSTESRTESGDSVEHDGPDVTVTVGDLENGFYVEDDGRGIPPEERDRIFEAGHTTKADGTGLGLAIVGEAAEAHGWEVDVVAGSDGGARFEITGVTAVQ